MKKLYLLITACLLAAVTLHAEEAEHANLISSGDFEGITSVQDAGWALLNGTEMELVVSDNTLDPTSTQMLKLVTPTTATNAWNLQLRTPAATIVPGNRYIFSFDIRSEGVGKGRISTSAANQVQHQYWPDFDTDNNWKTISYATVNGDSLIAIGNEFVANFDMGYVADMVYYLDNVKLIDLNADDNGDDNDDIKIPEGYVSIYELQGEAERMPLEVAAQTTYQILGPGADWHLTSDWDFSEYENLVINLTFDPEDAGNQVAVRFNANGPTVKLEMFTLPTSGTNFSAVIDLEKYAENGKVEVGGMIFYNGATHWAVVYDGTPTAKPVTINYVAVGEKIDNGDDNGDTGIVNVFPAGSFDGYADLTALLAEWTLKNGETDKLELLESDNTIDPDSEKMLKLVARDASTNDWDLQLATPLIPLVEGNQYMITFDIRSEGIGRLRVSTGAANQLPGNQYLQHIDTDEKWLTARYIFPYGDPNRPILAGEAGQVELNFDMGTVAGMVYFMDNIKVLDITGLGFEVDGLNLFAGGTFDIYEDVPEVLTEWTLKNGETDKLELLTSTNNLDASSEKMLKLVARDASSNDWDLQLATPLIPLVEGRQYMVSYDIRSEGVGKLRISTGAANQFPGNQYWQHVDTGEEWMTVRHTFLYNDPNRALIAGPAEGVELNFDMGTVAGMTYYMDNVKVMDITGTSLARFVADDNGDPDDELIYSITMALPAGEYDYKYFLVADAPTWDLGEWTGGDDRAVNVTAEVTTEDTWGVQTAAVTKAVGAQQDDVFLVTFTVDMTDAVVGEGENAVTFDPELHSVYIAGSFPGDLGWNQPGSNPALEMTIGDTGVVSVPEVVVENQKLRLFPNPASSNFTVATQSRIRQIMVSDVSGRTVQSIAADGYEVSVDTSNLRNGIYIISVHTDNGIAVSKLQVQR